MKEFLSRDRDRPLDRRPRARHPSASRSTTTAALVTYRELNDGADAFAAAFAEAGLAARRPRRDADRQLARARDGALRLREARADPAAALVAAARRRSSRYQLDDAEPSLFLVEDELRGARARRPATAFERLATPQAGGARHRTARRDGGRRAAPDLHVRDDREAEGRAAHARELLLDEPLASTSTTGVHGDDVVLQLLPQFHVGGWNVQALLALAEGRDASSSSGSSTPTRVLRLIEEKRVTTMMGVPPIYLFLAQHPRLRRRRPVEPRARGRRRRADARGAARDLGGARHRDRAGLRPHRGGAERALPAAGGRRAQARLRRQAVPVRRRAPLRRGRAAGARPERLPRLLAQRRGDGRGVHRRRLAAHRRRRRGATTRASTGSRAASRTCTSRAARTSTRPRSRRCCTSIRRSSDAAVVGVPDERWGEIGVAFVVADGVGDEELIAWCAARLAQFKVPSSVRFVAEIPRNCARQDPEAGAGRRGGARDGHRHGRRRADALGARRRDAAAAARGGGARLRRARLPRRVDREDHRGGRRRPGHVLPLLRARRRTSSTSSSAT